MPQALSTIFTNGTSASKGLDLGMLGIGTLSQLLAQHRYQSGIYGPYTSALGRAASLNPAVVAAGIQKLQAPLSQNLTNSVSNAVQANMASRGLAQAPGIFSANMAEALAPYELKNREDAMQAFYQMIGAPAAFNPGFALATGKPSPLDLSGIISKIRAAYNGGAPASGGIVDMTGLPTGSVINPPPNIPPGALPDMSTWFPPAQPTFGGAS